MAKKKSAKKAVAKKAKKKVATKKRAPAKKRVKADSDEEPLPMAAKSSRVSDGFDKVRDEPSDHEGDDFSLEDNENDDDEDSYF